MHLSLKKFVKFTTKKGLFDLKDLKKKYFDKQFYL